MHMIDNFKKFIFRGNVMDMAAGVIIGGAFGKIVTSLVNDMLMPPIGLLLGRVNFTDLFISLNGQSYASLAEAQAAGAPTLNYGIFLNTLISFTIIALSIFVFIQIISKLKHKEKQTAPAAPPAPPRQEILLEEIRDLLAKR